MAIRLSSSSFIKMFFLWITLLFLCEGYSLVPVKTVQLGEPVTFTCPLPKGFSNRKIYWYKQSAGDTLKLILAQLKSITPEYSAEFSKSRFNVNTDDNFSNLTVLKTFQEDEGLYHCGVEEWTKSSWSGAYLLVKENTQTTSKYNIVQQPLGSNPLHPGDTVTLQCSVLSDSDTKTCPGDHNMIWFRAESDNSHPNIIFSDENRSDECEKSSETQKRCIYRFSKSVSPSDVGTYYCAVATCEKILFGNGTRLELVQKTQSVYIQTAILIVCLAISVIGNVFLICKQRGCNPFKENAVSEAQTDTSQPGHDNTETDDELSYTVMNFSKRKARGRTFAEDSVYSQVKC